VILEKRVIPASRAYRDSEDTRETRAIRATAGM
jgi:hypothetical protein